MDADLAKAVRDGESEGVEFKEARTPLETIAKSICGMLNQRGGFLLWGVSDKGRVSGMDDADKKGTVLNDYLMQHLNPRPFLSISPGNVDGKEIIVVEVPRGADKPYSINRQIWVRVGAHTLKADRETSTDIVQKAAVQLDRWEREVAPGFELADCDTQELAQARKEIDKSERFGMEVPEGNEELLQRLYLTKGGQLTNASVVLFARQPAVWAPNLAVRILSYGSEKSEDLAADIIEEGPAIRVLKAVVATIRQRTGYSARFHPDRLEREDRPAYPLFALREGLVNAMVHRDYEAVGGGLVVELYPGHLVIRNPGKLPEGWDVRDLQSKHESHPRNPDIARVFYLRELMDQLGKGIQRIVEACTEGGAKKPIWHAENGVVSLTLYRAPEPSSADLLLPRQLDFLESIDVGKHFKPGDYAAQAQISERQARRDLTQMESLGYIEQRGRGPSTVYRRTERNPS